MFDPGGFDSRGVGVNLAEIAAALRQWDRDLDDAARIDVLGALEEVKAVCAATQARVTADLNTSIRASRAELPMAQRGRGIASQVALARRDAPSRGDKHLGFAIALVHEMPHTLARLETGALSEWRATLLVQETACLTREDRSTVDAVLCADPATLNGLGDNAIKAKARAAAADLDVEAMVRRARKAVGDRHVASRPAPDTMAYVSALLPVAQGVAVHTTLGRDADTLVAAGDERTRAQIMADLLVERVTGLSDATAMPPITVNLVISDQALLGDGSEPAHVQGYGAVPTALAKQWIRNAAEQSETDTLLRQVYANPDTGALTATESRARIFPKGLARLIDLRDGTCRTPWCDAPIRHHDHIHSHGSGGRTTADNGAGLCAACNYAKQGAGWTASGHREPGQLHVMDIRTPTGHRYRSTAPPLPKPLPFSEPTSGNDD